MKFKELENKDLVLENGKVIPKNLRTPCEVYSRVVGYLSPVRAWNKGKKQEFKDRKVYKVDKKE